MDFTNADHFLDHLELHQNGTFVLVKRDLVSIPSQPLSPKIHLNNNNNNLSQSSSDRVASAVENNNNHIIIQERERVRELAVVTEEETSNLPIVPEELKNQIKIEPISEDEEEEEESLPPSNIVANIPEQHHISNRTSEHSSQLYNNDSNDGTIMHSSSSPLNDNNSTETGDPNQQLLVLSNPRIGDGPGEYLCNVCHAKFVYKNNLKSHLKRHLGIYP